MRSFIRLDPKVVEEKLKAGYTLAQIGAWFMLQCQAEQQPERGRFRSMGLLKAAMDCAEEVAGAKARASQFLPFLLDKDITRLDDGTYYAEGWDELQEGDIKPQERMEVVRGRRGRPGDSGSPGARRQARYRAKQASQTTGDDIPSDASHRTDSGDVTRGAPSDASLNARDLDVSTNRRPKAVSTSGRDASPGGDGDAADASAVQGPKRPTGPPMGPDAVALVQGYQELGYPQPSGSDQIRATEFVAELLYLTVPEMLARMREHLAWCEREGKQRPQSLGGFWNTLRTENDHRRDAGAKQRGNGGGPRLDGLHRIDLGGLRVEPGGLAP